MGKKPVKKVKDLGLSKKQHEEISKLAQKINPDAWKLGKNYGINAGTREKSVHEALRQLKLV